jgi:hypothetical protein
VKAQGVAENFVIARKLAEFSYMLLELEVMLGKLRLPPGAILPSGIK